MLSTTDYNKKFEDLPEAEIEDFSEQELEEGAWLLAEALTLPPPPMVIVRG